MASGCVGSDRPGSRRKESNAPEGSAELLVIHSGLVLALAPLLSDQLRLVEFELALLSHPGNAVSGVLVCQQLEQELPQLDLTVVAWEQRNTAFSLRFDMYCEMGPTATQMEPTIVIND